MKTKIPSLFFFTLLALSLLVALPNFVEEVNATDYDVFEIAGASTNLGMTYVWDNYLYVHNNTYLLKYDLANKTLDDSINLGASTVVNELLGRGDYIFLRLTEIATDKVACIDLISFIEKDRIAEASLTDWNNDILNIAYYDDSGTDIWAWTRLNGTDLDIYDNYASCLLAWHEPYPQYARFVGYASGSHGTLVNYVDMSAIIHNGTGIERDVVAVSISQHRGSTHRIEFTLAPSIINYTYIQDDTVSMRIKGHNVNAFTDTQGRFRDEIYGWSGVYISQHLLGSHTVDSTLAVEGYDLPTTDLFYYYYDTVGHTFRFRSNSKTSLEYSSHWCWDVAPYIVTWTKPPITLTFPSDCDTDRGNKFGIISALETLDNYGFDALFVGYVRDSDSVPVVYKVIASTWSLVGELPSPTWTPDNCSLWTNKVGTFSDYQDDSMVAVFTQNADTTLYVCVNLIEGQYMRYGEDENIIAQLYKCYPSASAPDNFRVETRWMVDDSGYTRVINTPVYFYVDSAFYDSYFTTGSGLVQIVYYTSSYPVELSFYMNKTGYNDQWINVTIYDYNPFEAYCTVQETPELMLTFIDNRETANLRVLLNLYRYTGEIYNSAWFGNVPRMYITGETYAGTALESTMEIGVRDADANGEIQFILSYTVPYSYILKHYFRTTDQYGATGNFTNDAQIEFSYDSSTGDITSGEYVGIPDAPVLPEYYPDDSVNPTTIEEFAVIWTNNTGFLMALGLILAVTVGFAKISPQSAVFGVIVLLGMTIAFLGYTGLIPFPVFIVVLLAMVIGITVVFTGLLTGGRGEKKG